MGLFDNLFKKKISSKSANFACLVKSYCMESGIPVETQLNITKAIAKDFIDNKKMGIGRFVYMEYAKAKAYLVQNGMSEMDAEIFWSIIQSNKEVFLNL